MIKFYDSVEKWQFSFFHPESLCNKRIDFFAMLVKRHFPLPNILSIMDLLSQSGLDKGGPFQWIIVSLPTSLIYPSSPF